MCIICRMREAGASEEVMELANELKDAFDTSMLIHQEVLNDDRKHNAKEVAALYGMRDAMIKGGERQDMAAKLSEMLGIRVEVLKPTEGLEKAIMDAVKTGTGIIKVNADEEGNVSMQHVLSKLH